jgi:hypothetical protein
VHTEFWWGNVKEGYQVEDPGVDGKKIRCAMGRIEWVDLAQDSDKWRAVAKAVLNFQVP